MNTHGDDLHDLDITIAAFILPRLRAFRDTTQSYPADLDSLNEWHAELDSMIALFESVVSGEADDDDEVTTQRLQLFARRYRDLWQ